MLRRLLAFSDKQLALSLFSLFAIYPLLPLPPSLSLSDAFSELTFCASVKTLHSKAGWLSVRARFWQ